LLALAVAHGELTATDAWRVAHVDEDFEMRAWGEDAEALRRRAGNGARWRRGGPLSDGIRLAATAYARPPMPPR